MFEIDIGNLKTRNSRSWVRYETFIHLLEFKGFSTWGERHTIFLCCLLLHRQFSTQPTRGARSAQSRLASPRPESQPSSPEAGTLLTDFFSNLSPRFQCVTSPKYPCPIPIWHFYFDISEGHILSTGAWTPALMLHLTNPYAKRKVLCLTKPKGKIYKTKLYYNNTCWLCLEEQLFILEHAKKFIEQEKRIDIEM